MTRLTLRLEFDRKRVDCLTKKRRPATHDGAYYLCMLAFLCFSPQESGEFFPTVSLSVVCKGDTRRSGGGLPQLHAPSPQAIMSKTVDSTLNFA